MHIFQGLRMFFYQNRIDFCDSLGISPSHLTLIEQFKRQPSLPSLKKIYQHNPFFPFELLIRHYDLDLLLHEWGVIFIKDHASNNMNTLLHFDYRKNLFNDFCNSLNIDSEHKELMFNYIFLHGEQLFYYFPGYFPETIFEYWRLIYAVSIGLDKDTLSIRKVSSKNDRYAVFYQSKLMFYLLKH